VHLDVMIIFIFDDGVSVVRYWADCSSCQHWSALGSTACLRLWKEDSSEDSTSWNNGRGGGGPDEKNKQVLASSPRI
jgi:hypothetical protein